MAYADISDVGTAWRSVADYETSHFEQTLEDAALWLDSQLESSGKDPAAYAATHRDVLRFLSVNLVRRSVGELNPTRAEAQWSQLTEPYADNATAAVVRSDFYLTKWEKRMLGTEQGRAGFSGGE